MHDDECFRCRRDDHDRCTTATVNGHPCACWEHNHYGLTSEPDDDWPDTDAADARQNRYERYIGW